jgi:S1-C subfamily serine protease/class 3 adenylate cyclase
MSAERKPDLHLEIAHVLFIDVVGYSKLLADEQSETLQLLNQIVRGTAEFRTGEEKGELIRLPTGDGIALVYLTKPEAPVQCALQISKAIKSYPELQLRMGIHSGSVNQMRDVNDRSNVTGAGINIAQRVMDCGDAGHILLSRRVAEDLEQYRLWQPYLHDLGECEVKHGVRVHVFNLYTDEVGNRDVPAKLKPIAQEPAAAVVTSAGESARSTHRLIAATVLLVITLALGFVFWVVSHRAAPKSTGISPERSPSSPLPAEIGTPLDLPALAQKARRAVVLIVGYDPAGKIIETGSGIFVSADGRLVTNCHVIEGIVNAQAKLESGAIYNIDGVLACSSALDLAVLKADARDMQFLLVDSASNPPQPGTRIAVIGSPLALEGSLSEGIVSANRSGEDGSWLQISAPISPGSSGSPVLDRHGRVVGVATVIAKEGQNVNFARPSHDLWNFLQTIDQDAKPKRLSEWSPDEGIQTFIQAFVRDMGSNDATLQMRYYNEPCRYYDQVNIALPAVRKDIEQDITAWKKRAYSLHTQPVIRKTETLEYTVTFEMAYTLEDPNPRSSGILAMSLRLRPDNGTFLIAEIQKTVILARKRTTAVAESPASAPATEDTEVGRLFEKWLSMSNAGDIEQEASLYAEPTDYIGFGMLSRQELVQALQTDLQRWPKQHYTVSKGPLVEKLSGSEWRVTFAVNFDVRDPSKGKQVTGTANLTWLIRRRESGELEIASSKEQVTSSAWHDIKRSGPPAQISPSQPPNASSATPQPASSIESATPEIRKAKPVLSASPQQLVRVYVKKYGVSTLLPTDVFPDAKKLSNSDQSFLQGNSWTGQTTLTFSSVRETLGKVYAECATEHPPQAPSKTVQYKVLKPTWFVVSGDLGSEADSSLGFYTKGVKKDSSVVIMHFQYREDDFPFSEEAFTAMSRGFDGH